MKYLLDTNAVNGLVLVTRNTDDFGDFPGLIVGNWFDPKIGTGA